MDLFDRHNITFISVTQSFNTASSMGRRCSIPLELYTIS
ncbi:hypothetical protein MIDIC_250001 [Alphaproteobacteria bacterium]